MSGYKPNRLTKTYDYFAACDGPFKTSWGRQILVSLLSSILFVAWPAEYRSSGVMTFIVECGWSGVSEGSRHEIRYSCQSDEGIQPQFRLAKSQIEGILPIYA
jgi:hypothetical protein